MRMPIVIAALAMFALFASVFGAQAQGMGPSTARAQQATREAKEKPPKADDDAYKNALKTVPAAKNTDPWGSMRGGGSSSSGH
jgi:hypothetical protein